MKANGTGRSGGAAHGVASERADAPPRSGPGSALARAASRAWRFAATGVGLPAFYLVAFAVGLTLAPYALLRFRRNRALAAIWLRTRFCAFYRLYFRAIEAAGVMTYRVEGAERLRAPNALVVANHPTALDAVAVLACTTSALCVTKKEDWWNPTLRIALDASQMIPNTGGRDVVARSVAALRGGETLVLFPEGTRSPAGGKHPFRRGAAHVALEARRDVLPVLVTCTPPVLGKRQRWWRIPPRAFELRLRVLDPVPIADYARADLPTPLAARMLTRALDELFAKELQRALGESAS
ncbi:MAG: 1-acyl-sn-glycerol-3-phosphate acyltransferase [Myxococcales bacterium]|nr:1-acyl-sn-glycerol-3-phosphate acyltransferase [Myxococcales bacterium]